MSRIIIAGPRTFLARDEHIVWLDVITSNIKDIEVVSGHALGGDQFGEYWAQLRVYIVKIFKPDWDGNGNAAGHIRNRDMGDYAKDGNPGVLAAFWDGKSKGTKGMIDYAIKIGLQVRIYRTDLRD